MEQSDMFLDTDIYDALRDVVRALGGVKKVSARLWPSKNGAGAMYLSDCLNRDRRETLDPNEVLTLLRWAREIGYHAGIEHICTSTGYSRPDPIHPEDELAELQKAFNECVGKLGPIADRIEALRPVLKVAK